MECSLDVGCGIGWCRTGHSVCVMFWVDLGEKGVYGRLQVV